jgi:ABC-type glycerol-3-phosphate transport system substrate-binding protein
MWAHALVLVTLALSALAPAPPALAQDARLEAARKEGKVVWYTSLALTSAEKVAKLFEVAYPGVKVEVHRTGSQRVLQEVDFTFSREIQQVMADSEGLYTGHPEVKYPTDKPKLSELKLLSVDPEELEKRHEEIRKRFVEFFGA